MCLLAKYILCIGLLTKILCRLGTCLLTKISKIYILLLILNNWLLLGCKSIEILRKNYLLSILFLLKIHSLIIFSRLWILGKITKLRLFILLLMITFLYKWKLLIWFFKIFIHLALLRFTEYWWWFKNILWLVNRLCCRIFIHCRKWKSRLNFRYKFIFYSLWLDWMLIIYLLICINLWIYIRIL